MITIRSLVVLVVAVTATAACTEEPAPAAAPTTSAPTLPAPSSPATGTPATGSPATSTPATGTPAVTAAPVKAPPVVPGELMRQVMTTRNGASTTVTKVRRNAKPGQDYSMQAACADQDPARTLTYTVKVGHDRTRLAQGEVTCDGEVQEVSFSSRLVRGRATVDLAGGPVDSAYAIIVPSEQQ